MNKPIYLDYNGTTPHDPRVIEAMRPFLEEDFGNPSSSHWYGKKPKQAVEQARGQVAACLGCRPDEILFTSGGTESNNHALKSIAGNLFTKGTHIITSRIEHPAILEVCRFMEAHGFKVTYLPVDASGRVSVADVEATVTPETIMISIMHANNEVGTIQPIREIAEIAKAQDILMHTDAAQSIGKIPADVDDLNVHLLSLAGHKLYAPKGIGALFIHQTVRPSTFCHGAGQEMGRRGGTENVLEIVGLGTACDIARKDLDTNQGHMEQMRNRLEVGLTDFISDVRVNGHPKWRLPNTLSISFLGLEANRILDEISPEVAASAGAACHADTIEVSHVLQAMKLPEDWAKGTIRLTTGRMTTERDIDRAVDVISTAVRRLRG